MDEKYGVKHTHYVCVCVCVCIYICVYIYVYIYIYIGSVLVENSSYELHC